MYDWFTLTLFGEYGELLDHYGECKMCKVILNNITMAGSTLYLRNVNAILINVHLQNILITDFSLKNQNGKNFMRFQNSTFSCSFDTSECGIRMNATREGKISIVKSEFSNFFLYLICKHKSTYAYIL